METAWLVIGISWSCRRGVITWATIEKVFMRGLNQARSAEGLVEILRKKCTTPGPVNTQDMDGTSETAELAVVKNDVNDLDARESGCLEENVTTC